MFDHKAKTIAPIVLDLWNNNKIAWKSWLFHLGHFSNRPSAHPPLPPITVSLTVTYGGIFLRLPY